MARFVYFTREQFGCKCGCQRNGTPDDFIQDLDDLRESCGFPLIILDGWRCDEPGPATVRIKTHNKNQHYAVQDRAFEIGFTGIAAGDGFVHLDNRKRKESWTY